MKPFNCQWTVRSQKIFAVDSAHGSLFQGSASRESASCESIKGWLKILEVSIYEVLLKMQTVNIGGWKQRYVDGSRKPMSVGPWGPRYDVIDRVPRRLEHPASLAAPPLSNINHRATQTEYHLHSSALCPASCVLQTAHSSILSPVSLLNQHSLHKLTLYSNLTVWLLWGIYWYIYMYHIHIQGVCV